MCIVKLREELKDLKESTQREKERRGVKEDVYVGMCVRFSVCTGLHMHVYECAVCVCVCVCVKGSVCESV